MKKYFIPSLIIFFLLSALNLGCKKDDSPSTTTDPGLTLTITIENTGDFSNAKYMVFAYMGGENYDTDASVTNPLGTVTTNNEVTISHIQENTLYAYYIWIDTNGDGDYTQADNDLILFYDTTISENTQVSKTFLPLVDKQVNLLYSSAIIKTVKCFYFLNGQLSSVNKGDLWASSPSSTIKTIIGEATGEFDNATNATALYIFEGIPVPATPNNLKDSQDQAVIYDLFCYVDMNNNGQRDAGDLEGEPAAVVSSNSDFPASVTLTEITP